MNHEKIVFTGIFIFFLSCTSAIFATDPVAALAPTPASVVEQEPFSAPASELISQANSIPQAQKANYQYFLDDFQAHFDAKGNYLIQIHKIVRVLTLDGVNSWSYIDREYQPWCEEPPELKARVVQESGQESWISAANIVDTGVQDDSTGLRTDTHRISAPLPKLETGAIIEYTLKIKGHEALPGVGLGYRLYLAQPVPVEERRVSFEYPEHLPFNWNLMGLPDIKPAATTKNGMVTLGFTIRNQTAFDDSENYLPYDKQPVPVITFSTAPSWQSIAQAYQKASDPLLDPEPVRAYAQKALEGIDPHSDPLLLTHKIASKLRQDIRYTGINFGMNAIIPHHPADTLKSGYGDCKDQASLLVACLRSVGVPARLVLLSSGFDFDVDMHVPTMDLFNHEIVQVPSLNLWIDPTVMWILPGQLPLGDQHRVCLPIDAGTIAPVYSPQTDPAANQYKESRVITLEENGDAQVKNHFSFGGTFDYEYRSDFGTTSTKDIQDWLEKKGKEDYDAKSASGSYSDPLDLSKGFEYEIVSEKADVAKSNDDSISVVLHGGAVEFDAIRSLCKEDKNAKPRVNDVYLPRKYSSEVTYDLVAPDGFQLKEVPPAWVKDLGPVRLSGTFSSTGPGNLHARYVMEVLSDHFSPDELKQLRDGMKEYNDSNAEIGSFENIGKALANAGKYQEALQEFRRFQLKHPKEALHHIQATETLLDAGFPEDALVEAETAVSLEPNSEAAHQNVAFASLYGSFGVQFTTGCNIARALEEYKKAATLNPKDPHNYFTIALILEHGDNFVFRGKGTPLADAVSYYEKAKDKIESWGKAERYMADLFLLGRYEGILKFSATLEDRTNGVRYVIAVIALQQGAEQALKAANSLISSLGDRRTAIRQAALDILAKQQYAEAADLLLAAARGTENFAAISDYATLIRSIQPFKVSESPRDAKELMCTLLDEYFNAGNLDQKLLAPSIRETENFHYGASDIESSLGKMQEGIAQSGLVGQTITDLMATFMTAKTAAVGRYELATLSLPKAGLNNFSGMLMLNDEGKRFLLFGTSDNFNEEGIGREMLNRLDAGDIESAKILLSIVQNPQKYLSDFPKQDVGALIDFVSKETNDPKKLRLAAAVLNWSTQDKNLVRNSIDVVIEAAHSETDHDRKHKFLALALGFAALIHDSRVQSLGQELIATGLEDKPEAQLLVARDLLAANLTDEAISFLKSRLESQPDNVEFLRELARAYVNVKNHSAALETYGKILASGKQTEEDYNSAGWDLLFQNKPDFQLLETWGLTRKLVSGHPNSLHTLVCALAAEGHYEEARSAFVKYLSNRGYGSDKSDLWVAKGLLARSFGLLQIAQVSFQKAQEADTDVSATTSCGKLGELWMNHP